MSLLTNITAYWKLDGNSNDSVGSNNGTDTNVAYNASYGIINQGALFRSTYDTTITFGTNDTITTINFWVNGTTFFVGAAGKTICYSSTSNNTIQGASSTGNILIYDGSSNIDFGSAWATGAWHMYTFVWDGTYHNLYKDGVYVTQMAGNQIHINGFGRTGSTGFYGDLDEVGVWSRQLTAGEISTLYNGGKALQYPFTSLSSSFNTIL